MKLKLLLGVLVLAAPVTLLTPLQGTNMKKLTPIITVDAIEPCLGFWVDRLGFEKTMEVPGESGLAFAGLASGGVEIMYQTRASVAADVPALAEGLGGSGALFIEVEDLDPILQGVEGADIVVPERTTFYGMREVWVRATCGTVVGFAQAVATED